MNCKPAKESEPSPLTQKEKPAALSQSGLPRRLLVKKALCPPLSKVKRTALPTLPSTSSALPLPLGALKRTASIESMREPADSAAQAVRRIRPTGIERDMEPAPVTRRGRPCGPPADGTEEQATLFILLLV